MAKIETVRIDELKTNLFVRQELNHDHVIALGLLIESGVELPAIKITPEKVVIDGRHRIEAHSLHNMNTIRAEVVQISSEEEMIAMAYLANVGGALPPTVADTENTVTSLLERGASKKRIGELLCLPPSLARRYIDSVQSRLNRAKLLRAANAVAEGGLNVPAAAEKYGVETKKLRDHFSPKRRQKRENAVEEAKKQLTQRFKSLGLSYAAIFRSLLQKFDDGDITPKQMEVMFKHIEKLQKQSARTAAGWKDRYLAKTPEVTETKKVKIA